MALSRQVIISDGTTKQYPITFADGYLSRDEVKVYEEFDDGTPNSDIAFTFINDNLIQLNRVPVSGNKIVIERDVEASARKVDFLPQYIKSSDLNTMYKHLLYLIQAVLDGRFEESIIKDLDMGYNRIFNLGAPQQDNDAVRLIDIKTYTDLAKDLNSQNAAHAAAAKQSELNAKSSETAAAQSASDALNSKNASVDNVEESRKWAVGTKQERPEGSSKYWADYAKSVTEGTLNETQITNCITKISQDIKLELNDGTLTLKAGSKVYVPNGVGVFKEILINSDISLTDTTNYNNLFVFYIDGRLERILSIQVFSGTNAPSVTDFLYWYDTKNNLIKRTTDGGSNWTSGNISFPLGLFSTNGAAFSSIDQVFNGFGYIGSTIFALPGVEGLKPDGRNTDGSLNNAKFTTTSVLTNSRGFSGNLKAYLREDAITYSSGIYYNELANENQNVGTNVYSNFCEVGTLNADSTGRVTSFNPKNCFHAVDYYDFKQLDDNTVHKTGDEEIYGVKTIVGAPRPLVVKNPDADFTYKSITSYSYMAFCDKNNQYAAYVGARSNRNGGHGAYMQCNPVDGVGTVGTIAVMTDAKGVTTYAPTPPATDKSTQLATTEWVRNYGAILDYTKGVTITGNGNKTASSNGVLMINASRLDNQGNEQVILVIDGQTFYYGNGTVNLDNPHIGQIYFPMKAGQKYNITSPNWSKITAKFFPYV